jgi:MerR family transcriptional regulator, light-induced transcriptional regulator
MSNQARHLRIGEAARRLGMTTAAVRAWETRYGVPAPERTAGGLRLYSDRELARVRTMRELVAGGMAPAEAARMVADAAISGEATTSAAGGADTRVTAGGYASPAALDSLAGELEERLAEFDEAGSQATLDRLLAQFSAEVVVAEVVLPVLRWIGDRWRSGGVAIAQEHFSTTVLRERLLALARGWDRGIGARAVLACPPGELHDVGLIAFGLSLRTHGWRVTYLGQNTPLETLVATVERLAPSAVVLAATMPESLHAIENELTHIADRTRLYVGGAAASGSELGRCSPLPESPVEAARVVAREAASRADDASASNVVRHSGT